jgi:hypothetical protein
MAQGISLYLGAWGTTLALFFALPFFVLIFEPLLWDLWLSKLKKASSNQGPVSGLENESEDANPEMDFYTHKDEMPGLDIENDSTFVDEFMEVDLEDAEARSEVSMLGLELELELPDESTPEAFSPASDLGGSNAALQLELTKPEQEDSVPAVQSDNPEESSLAERLVAQYGEYDPHLDLPDFKMPPLELLVDHGNADFAINDDGTPNTAHSTNPVPCILIDDDYKQIKDGKLADIAPSICKMMNIATPAEMNGNVLID